MISRAALTGRLHNRGLLAHPAPQLRLRIELAFPMRFTGTRHQARRHPSVIQFHFGSRGRHSNAAIDGSSRFMLPLLGIGRKPAIVALFLNGLLPIVRGTLMRLREIPIHLMEPAIVLGPRRAPSCGSTSSRWHRARTYRALKRQPSSTLAPPRLGRSSVRGVWRSHSNGNSPPRFWTGSPGVVPTALLAIAVQAGIEALELLLVPRGLQLGIAGKD